MIPWKVEQTAKLKISEIGTMNIVLQGFFFLFAFDILNMRFNRGLADCGKWRRKCSWLFGRKESDNLPNTLISFTLRADFQSCRHSISEFRWEHHFSKELKIQGEGTVKTSYFLTGHVPTMSKKKIVTYFNFTPQEMSLSGLYHICGWLGSVTLLQLQNKSIVVCSIYSL